MRGRISRILALFGGVAALFLVVLFMEIRSVLGPKHEGKYLGNLLAEIRNAKSIGTVNPQQPEVLAVQAIGTNAVPWLLSELGTDGSNLQQTINNLMKKQKIDFRFPDINDRLGLAVLGFEILGPAAASAIPQVLALVDRKPGYAPLALAAIGSAAVPALRQCLATTNTVATSGGPMNLAPGNTIAGLHNAFNSRRLTKADIQELLPDIQKLAAGTNSHAAIYAQKFLAFLEKSSE